METSQKEESILTLFKELTRTEEIVLTMYFGLDGKPKTTLLEMGYDRDMTEEDVLKIKNDGIRKFINIYINEEDIRFLDGPKTQINEKDTVSIIPAIAGGTTVN